MDNSEVEALQKQVAWCDSTALVQSPDGTLVEAGTCLKINDMIMLLKFLSNEQLLSLRESVTNSVNYELNKRNHKE